MKSKLKISTRRLRKFINHKYNLDIETIKYTVFDRNFHGYTLYDEYDQKYFLKILDKSHKKSFEKESLKTTLKNNFYLMLQCKLNFISYPIVTVNGNFLIDFSDHHMVLYKYINGKQPKYTLSEYYLKDLGKKLGKLHECNKLLKKKIYKNEKNNPRELVKSLQELHSFLPKEERDKIDRKASQLLSKQFNLITKLGKSIIAKKRTLNFKSNLSLTHGNPVKENILIKDGVASLIETEHISLAPREKDLAMYVNRKDYKSIMEGYKKVFPKVKLRKGFTIFYYKLHLLSEIVENLEYIISESHNSIRKKSLKRLHNLISKVGNIEEIEKEIGEVLKT